jgi:hypothetical protein
MIHLFCSFAVEMLLCLCLDMKHTGDISSFWLADRASLDPAGISKEQELLSACLT